MDKIFKTFRPEIKSVNTEDGTIDMLIPMSTATIDRDGESIEPLGWKKSLPEFRKRPVLLSSHSYGDLRKQIGEFTQIKVNEDGLFAKPKYYINQGNDEADWAFNLASKGMAAYSVGFMPIKWEDNKDTEGPRRTYTEQELLEISHVVVPSNRDAIQGLRSKGLDPVNDQVCDDLLKSDLITKPEETDNFIHIPAPGEEGKHEGHRIRTLTLRDKEGIKAKYCGECKKNISYMFDKDKGWTMEKAKAWVKEHEGKSLSDLQEHKVPQKQIEDEIDFVKLLISENGINPETTKMAWDLVRGILRLTGDDMPDDIKDKFKTVSTVKNDEKIQRIILQTVQNVIKNS